MRLIELSGPGDQADTHEAWRQRLAQGLRGASAWLARLADALARIRAPRPRPELEFYAEAGAPEGALYADGRRVGSLPGVIRL